MANNVTVLISQEMAKLQKQYNGLAEALRVINEISGIKGRPQTLAGLTSSASKAPKKQGRPKGGKNKTKAAQEKPMVSTKKVKRATKKKSAKKAVAPKAATPAAPKAKEVKTKTKRRGAPKGKRVARGINLNKAIREHIVSANRFVFSTELADKFNSYYPEKSKADFSKYISVLLSIAKKGKKLSATSLDKSGAESRASYWGLPEWFEGDKGKQEFYK